jgi:hypothetical protein
MAFLSSLSQSPLRYQMGSINLLTNIDNELLQTDLLEEGLFHSLLQARVI